MQFSAYRQVDLILDFGEVSTDRQVLSRVTRKVLSNSKHNLLSSDTSICISPLQRKVLTH